MRNKIFFGGLVFCIIILIITAPLVQSSAIQNVFYNTLNFLGIIKITKANHLNSNRVVISDIYNEVKELDDIWSEEIPDGDYVRVTFEVNLTSDRDITLYPRAISGNPRIEVYEKGGIGIIAEFSDLQNNQYNKAYLTNLIGEQETFDLKIIGGSVEFDHIVDPTQIFIEDWEVGNFNQWNNANWAIATDQKHGGSRSAKCVQSTTCDMHSTTAMDTSSASEINISFWIMDDDNEPSDTFWYINLSDGSWEQRSNIDGGSLCGDDTWCFFSVVLSGANYKHAGFSIRFEMGEDNGENYWIDDINVSMEIVTDTCSCPGSGNNWEIDMGDSCPITDPCDLGTGNITFIGTGTTTFNAAISCANLEYPTTDQTLMIGSNAVVTIG